MLNKVTLIGNLGADPETKEVSADASVSTLSIATSEKYTDRSGNKQEKTEWHRVVLWRGLSDIASRYLKKGDKVYIEGKLTTRSYETNTGEKRYITEIIGKQLIMLGGKRGDDTPSQNYPAVPQNTPPQHEEPVYEQREADEDLPF